MITTQQTHIRKRKLTMATELVVQGQPPPPPGPGPGPAWTGVQPQPRPAAGLAPGRPPQPPALSGAALLQQLLPPPLEPLPRQPQPPNALSSRETPFSRATVTAGNVAAGASHNVWRTAP